MDKPYLAWQTYSIHGIRWGVLWVARARWTARRLDLGSTLWGVHPREHIHHLKGVSPVEFLHNRRSILKILNFRLFFHENPPRVCCKWFSHKIIPYVDRWLQSPSPQRPSGAVDAADCQCSAGFAVRKPGRKAILDQQTSECMGIYGNILWYIYISYDIYIYMIHMIHMISITIIYVYIYMSYGIVGSGNFT